MSLQAGTNHTGGVLHGTYDTRSSNSYIPKTPVLMSETALGYVLELIIPGFQVGDFTVRPIRNVLMVRIGSKQVSGPCSYPAVKFFRFNDHIQVKEATYRDGILTVILNRSP